MSRAISVAYSTMTYFATASSLVVAFLGTALYMGQTYLIYMVKYDVLSKVTKIAWSSCR